MCIKGLELVSGSQITLFRVSASVNDSTPYAGI